MVRMSVPSALADGLKGPLYPTRSRRRCLPKGETFMEIKKVAVLGCGLMGSGIAQTAAMAGFETTVCEVSEELLQKGFASIEKSLERFAGKGTITAEQQKQTRDRLFGTTSFNDLADS